MDHCDKVQLCAQAICLEEMLNVAIPEGALFYGRTRRREDVVFDEKLRLETEDTAKKVHELIESGMTPKAEYSKKCKKLLCLIFACLKPLGRQNRSAAICWRPWVKSEKVQRERISTTFNNDTAIER
jgi:CRISPR-associated exonuclease Cas4